MNPCTLPDSALEALLRDDTPCGDATTQALRRTVAIAPCRMHSPLSPN